MRHALLLLILLLPLPALAAEPAVLAWPAYLEERVKARAVLADPACMAKKGAIPACFCAIDTAYPRFVTAAAAKAATDRHLAEPAEPPNANALPHAEALNDALKAFTQAGVEEGVCPPNYSQKQAGRPRDFLASAAIVSTLEGTVTFLKGDYIGMTYRYYDRDGSEEPVLSHRGLLLNIATGEAVNLIDLLGANQDEAINKEILRQQKIQARPIDAPGFARPFKMGECPNCLGYYYTPKGLDIEMLSIGKKDEPVVVDVALPSKLILDAPLRALFSGKAAPTPTIPANKAK